MGQKVWAKTINLKLSKCLSIIEWRNQLHFHTATRMNKLQVLTTKWVNLISRMLNRRSQTQKNADFVAAFTQRSKTGKTMVTEIRAVAILEGTDWKGARVGFWGAGHVYMLTCICVHSENSLSCAFFCKYIWFQWNIRTNNHTSRTRNLDIAGPKESSGPYGTPP